MDTTLSQQPKQGFRFSKSGTASPYSSEKSLKRVLSQPSLVSEPSPDGPLGQFEVSATIGATGALARLAPTPSNTPAKAQLSTSTAISASTSTATSTSTSTSTSASLQLASRQLNSFKRSQSLPVATSTSSAPESNSDSSSNGLSFPATASIPPPGVDAKLYQIVKRIVTSTPSLLIVPNSKGSRAGKNSQTARKNNIQAVSSLVLERHREYRRKDVNLVRGGVEGALDALGAALAGAGNNSGNHHNNNSNNNSSGGGNSGNNGNSNFNSRKRRASSSLVPVGGGSNTNTDSEPISSNSNKSSTSSVPTAAPTSSSPAPESPSKRAKKSESPDKPTENNSSISVTDSSMDVDVDAGVDYTILEDDSSVATENNIENNSNSNNNHNDNSNISNNNKNISNSNNNPFIMANTPTTPKATGGMLNASLRDRYRDVQREREKEASAAVDNKVSDASETNALNSSATATDAKPSNNSSNTPTTTPKKKKKSIKKPSSRPSTNDFNGSNLNDLSTSTTPLLLPTSRPTERYSTLGGLTDGETPLLHTIRHLIEYPLTHPELFLHLGVEPPRGVLLRGPPGCGKTHLAKAIAGELNVNYFQVSAPELVGGISGESEARVRGLFESAGNLAPSIIFIDEIDAIAPKRGEGSGGGGGKSMEKRIVAQLLTSMDSIHPSKTRNNCAVMVLGATNRPDALDPALRRAGRFDREIVLGAPDEKAREAILKVMMQGMRVEEKEMDYKLLAKKTPGFVGADVRSLTREAAVGAINRIFQMELLRGSGGGGGSDNGNGTSSGEENGGNDTNDADDPNSTSNDIRHITPLTPQQLSPLHITMSDFLNAIPHVQPSSKREGFATVPDVTWSNIGALSQIREELTLSVLEPISHPESFEALGLPLPAGVLLYGPPGCGKTLLAKAIANESGANFISVKGPELLDKYVGESERAVRVVFERARSSSPCIIFFDELDSLCPKRGSDGGGGGNVSERVVNQLLTEMDGLDSRRSVFVIAATNRPELIDPAMLRPGRLDKLLYVPLPTPDDRYSILKALSKKVNLAPDVDLKMVAHDAKAEGFSGADCAALLREAGLAVLRDGVLKRSSQGGGSTYPGDSGDPSSEEKMETKDSSIDDGNNKSKDESNDANATPKMQITAHHFRYAFDHVLPSVSKKDQARYDRLRDRMARARTRGGAGATVNNGSLNEGGVGDEREKENEGDKGGVTE